MTSVAEDFIENPSVETFHSLTKDQLVEVGTAFDIELSSSEKHLKHTAKSIMLPFLIESGKLPPVDMREPIWLKELSERGNLVTENQLELRRVEIKA